ncbi:unnamed protein product [Closterium sp. NIES-54]
MAHAQLSSAPTHAPCPASNCAPSSPPHPFLPPSHPPWCALQVPMLAYAATDPLLNANAQLPYFVRVHYDDYAQMAVVADLVGFYNWTQVVALFESTDSAWNGFQSLTRLLQQRGTARVVASWQFDSAVSAETDVMAAFLQVRAVEASVFVLHLHSPTTIRIVLKTGACCPALLTHAHAHARAHAHAQDRAVEASVFVLHLHSPTTIRIVLKTAAQLGLFTAGYVWIATAGVMSVLSTDRALSPTLVGCEGMLGTLPFDVPTARLAGVQQAIKARANTALATLQSPDEALRQAIAAYDSLHLAAYAAAALSHAPPPPPAPSLPPGAAPSPPPSPVGGINPSFQQLEVHKGVRTGGGGGVRVCDHSMVAAGCPDLTTTSPAHVTSGTCTTSSLFPSHLLGQSDSDAAWLAWLSCCHILSLPSSSTSPFPTMPHMPHMPHINHVALLPTWPHSGAFGLAAAQMVDRLEARRLTTRAAAALFSQLLPSQPLLSSLSPMLAVRSIALLPYTLSYQFVAYGDGQSPPSYDAMLAAVANKTYDAAVGDITITSDRALLVDFTQPFEVHASSIPLPSVEAPQNSSIPLTSVEAPQKSSIPLPSVEAPQKSSIPLPSVEAPQKSYIPLPSVEAPQKSSIPLPSVEAPQNSSIPLPSVEAPQKSSIHPAPTS